MTYGLIRGIFKQIRALEGRDRFLGGAARANLRLHVESYHRQGKDRRTGGRSKEKDEDLPTSFLQFLQAANSEDSQFSQKARMKLVELVFGINKFANNRFQLTLDNPSYEMAMLEQSQQFKKLQSERERAFVRETLRKVLSGDETYPYRTLTEFFNDHRSEVCTVRQRKHIDKMDQSSRKYIEGVLSGEVKSDPYFKRIYEYYFTDISNEELAFESYLNSNFILVDFDDTEVGWKTSSKQIDKSREINERRIREGEEKKAGREREKERLKREIDQQLRESKVIKKWQGNNVKGQRERQNRPPHKK